MRQTIKETVAPVDIVSVLTTGVIESHLRVTYSADSSYLDGLAKAALTAVEKEVNETYGAITVAGANSEFTREFTIPYDATRIRSAVTVTYVDANEVTQTVEGANVRKSNYGYPMTVQISSDFKPASLHENVPNVMFFGASVDALALPEGLKQAVLMMMAHFYENREAVLSNRIMEPPLAFKYLCAQYKKPSCRQPYNPEFILR